MAGDRSEWTGICGGNSGDVLPTNSPPKDSDVRDNQNRLPPVGTIYSCDSNQTVVLPVNQTPQIDCRSLKNPSHKVAAVAIERDRALYRFVLDDSSERRHISLHPIDISWDCILQLFGIKNALCSAQQAVRVQQALSEGGVVIKGRWCISFAWNHLCH